MQQTEFSFILPQGYLDSEGNTHKEGIMRLATAYDEITPMRDPRVQRNPGYLVIILLARVITKLGTLESINTKINDSVLLADCFLETVTKKLTHFLEDGTPVRATLDCSFREWKDPEKQKKNENPIDDPVRIVKRGETLSSIATEEFGDPALWRIIADENRLINPRKLEPGTILTIPPL